jgi:hypothetical protein
LIANEKAASIRVRLNGLLNHRFGFVSTAIGASADNQ